MRRGSVVLACVLWVGVAWAGNAENGKAMYAARCSFCHGQAGKGDGPVGGALKPPPTNFARTDYWKSAKTDELREIVKNGKPGTAMAPFGTALSAEDIDDLLAYLKTFASQ